MQTANITHKKPKLYSIRIWHLRRISNKGKVDKEINMKIHLDYSMIEEE